MGCSFTVLTKIWAMFSLLAELKRQVWRRQIWHFELRQDGEGAVGTAVVIQATCYRLIKHSYNSWNVLFWMSLFFFSSYILDLGSQHKCNRLHYVKECGQYIEKMHKDDGDIQHLQRVTAELCWNTSLNLWCHSACWCNVNKARNIVNLQSSPWAQMGNLTCLNGSFNGGEM